MRRGAVSLPLRFLFLLVLTISPALQNGTAMAEGIHGYAEFGFNDFETSSRDSSNVTTDSRAKSFNQTYSLSLDNRIYPNLTLGAGGRFEKSKSTTSSGGAETDAESTSLQPFVGLRWGSPPFTASARYDRNEQTQKTSLSPTSTLVRENYSADLAWKPVDLPLLTLQFLRTNSFDEARSFLDTVDDHLTASTRYKPSRRLDLAYQFSWDHLTDRIEDVSVVNTIHSGRVAYSDLFWNRRITLDTSYSGSVNRTEVTAGAGGEVTFRLFPLAGLSSLNDVPTQGALDPNPAVIDGNLSAGTGIDIGLQPVGGDVRPRNVGLDFLEETEVNTLQVWVDRDLPPAVSGSFSWNVYVSADNQNWTLLQTIFPAPFGPFVTRFELRFQNVRTRFIKAVTAPLAPTVPGASGFPNIAVTELQAFLNRPAPEVTGATTATSHVFDFSTRTRILRAPALDHELSFFLTKAETSAGSSPARYTLSNALSFRQAFGRTVTGSARVAREDGKEAQGDRVGYRYTASVAAVPIPALRHSLIFSGQRDSVRGRTSESRALFLNNAAELYRGVNARLTGGASESKGETGVTAKTLLVNAGTNITPHPALSIGLTFSDSKTKQTGGDQPERTTFSRREDLTVSLTPFSTLHLSASYSILEQSDRAKQTTRSLSANWAPFPGGDLLLNISYSESLRLEDQQKSRTFTPSLRWNVTRYASLDMSYLTGKTSSPLLGSEIRSFNAVFRLVF